MMLLHSAASMHGHEFSPTNPKRVPLVRSPFSASSSRSSTSYENNPPSSIRPIRRLSSLPRKNSDRVSFQEPDLDAMTEDGLSYASEGSEATAGGTKRKRKSTRSSTVYLLAHPAPTLTREQKVLRIRPKLIFQLQRISYDKRPIPAIDVMPCTVVVPRIMKKFPRMFRGKRALGTNDVVIVKSEDYNSPDDNGNEDNGDDSVGNREVLAVICQTRGSSSDTEICLADGSVWNASYHGKGSYEFETTNDETGETTKARWVQRISPKRQDSSGQQRSMEEVASEGPKFIFSIVHANSRRHPILASLTKNTLDIPDTYTTCSSSASRYPPTSPIRSSGLESSPPVEDDVPVERTTHPLDNNTKILIQMTGIWVALKMGWSSYFSYSDSSPGNAGKTGGSSGHRARAASVDQGKSSPIDTREGTPESGNSLGGKGAKILKSGTNIFTRSPSGSSASTFNPAAPLPKRSVSTGTAYMQRVAARRVGHPPSTVPSDSERDMSPSPPNRASTTTDITSLNGAKNKHMPTTSPLALYGSDAPNPETPTKRHRRAQSAYFPNSPLKTQGTAASDYSKATPSQSYSNGVGSDLSTGYPSETEEKKGGRWRQLISFFRRGRTE